MLGTGGKERKKQAGISLVANNCEVVGDIHFTDQLQVNGYVKGNVIAEDSGDAKVSVSEHGCIEGEIRVPNVVINGEVIGDIYAAKHVELAAKARVKGCVYYNLIEMVLGAQVEGNLHHAVGARKEDRAVVAAESERMAEVSQKVVQPLVRG